MGAARHRLPRLDAARLFGEKIVLRNSRQGQNLTLDLKTFGFEPRSEAIS